MARLPPPDAQGSCDPVALWSEHGWALSGRWALAIVGVILLLSAVTSALG